MNSTLSPLQTELLVAFFRRESRFFLTGGAALAGFYLGHRRTADLDLFATADLLVEGEGALREAAQEAGAVMEGIVTAPGFRRRLLRRGDDAVIVDLVYDQAFQGPETKRTFGVIRVDPPGEILANKLCTLLSRAEPRDLVDVMALERAGFEVEDALPLAMEKDGGLTPAQLAWVLSQIALPKEAELPGAATAAELREFLQRLVSRLTRLSFPG